MVKYVVLKNFADLQDNKHLYRTGDLFPRDGVDVSEERVAELASSRNKSRKALISKVETTDASEPKPVVGKKKNKKTKKNA